MKCVEFFEGGKNVLIKSVFFVDIAGKSRVYKIACLMIRV